MRIYYKKKKIKKIQASKPHQTYDNFFLIFL